MAVRDYRKLHKELTQKYKDCSEVNASLVERYNEISARNKHLNAEMDKAVRTNKEQQVMLYEQRGIIGFLEAKIAKLSEMLPNE
jgi:hypothetical protein